jgi:hypothetical protein
MSSPINAAWTFRLNHLEPLIEEHITSRWTTLQQFLLIQHPFNIVCKLKFIFSLVKVFFKVSLWLLYSGQCMKTCAGVSQGQSQLRQLILSGVLDFRHWEYCQSSVFRGFMFIQSLILTCFIVTIVIVLHNTIVSILFPVPVSLHITTFNSLITISCACIPTQKSISI